MTLEVKAVKPGRGLDVGTGLLCQATIDESGEISYKTVRDSFLEIKPPNKLILGTMKKGLIKAGINFFEADDRLLVLGDDALTTSIERQMVIRRPMSKGVISPTEINALAMFKALLKELLGSPVVDRERIIFTVPAAPVDASFDVIYHETVIQSILDDLGFSGKAINEGHSLVFSELGDYDLTGVAVSMGAGQTNVAICNLGDLVTSFSVAKGGDYIDFQTAASLGFDPHNPTESQITPNLVTFIKEQGVDLLNPDKTDKIKLGITAHYKALLRYVVDRLVNHLTSIKNPPKFMKPVPVVLAGGTSLAPGAVQLFTDELYRQKHLLPFDVKEVFHSKKPLTAVSEGCLLALLSE